MRRHGLAWYVGVLALALAPALGSAQKSSTLAGTWEGTLKRGSPAMSREVNNRPVGTRTTLEIAPAAAGGAPAVKLIAVDVNKQIEITDVAVEGDTIRFKAPVFGASYEGKLSGDGAWIKGKWTQFGSSSSVNFKRTEARP